MALLSKIGLYANTVKHLKPSQVFYRVWRKAGGKTCLKVGYTPSPDVTKADIGRVPTLPELDFDPVFLARFNVDAILDNRIELLHHEEQVDWSICWHEELSTPLWRFNLHYFEYLLPLAKAYLDSGEEAYLNKAKSLIESWISSCPRTKGGAAWDPYTISMRIVNWLAFYDELKGDLEADAGFLTLFNASLADQFVHLGTCLEVDLLANHYLEDLKALVILACYFDDEATFKLAYPRLLEQVKEQILPDGMHFELSPMYHKIVLEDLMRAVAALEASGRGESAFREFRLQDMCDCLYSLERNTKRTPLFNDCGDNVAKSRDALLGCAKSHFCIEPVFKPVFPDAGYCVLERETDAGLVKVIFDTGNPGPEYAMGHVHCDALSFECFINGEPWIVNCGTYAYQDESRLEYKKTLSHSTVMVDGEEQHECWAPFRVARFGKGELLKYSSDNVLTIASARFNTFAKSSLVRTLILSDESLVLEDEIKSGSEGNSVLFFAYLPSQRFEGACECKSYAPEFGNERKAFKYERMVSSNKGQAKLILWER